MKCWSHFTPSVAWVNNVLKFTYDTMLYNIIWESPSHLVHMLCSACFPFAICNLFSQEIADKTDHADFETMKDLCFQATKLIFKDFQSTSKQRPIVYITLYNMSVYIYTCMYIYHLLYPFILYMWHWQNLWKHSIQIVTSPRGCELAVFASNHIGHSFDLSDYHDLIIIVLFWIDELHVVGVVDTGLTVKQADLQECLSSFVNSKIHWYQ